MTRIIIVSNRGPFDLSLSYNDLILKENIGGLATSLNRLCLNNANNSKYEFIWIHTDEYNTSPKVKKISKNYSVLPVFIPQDIYKTFYNDCCNQQIYPALLDIKTEVNLSENIWAAYKTVNTTIRDKVLEIYEPGDIIWIHDYHFMVLSELIRDIVKDAYISFFLHTPFYSTGFFDKFRTHHLGDSLIKSLLYADSLYFQIADYKNHFIDCISRKFKDVLVEDDLLYYNHRKTSVSFNPISIDFEYVNNLARLSYQDLTWEGAVSNKLILSVDRLDPSKGIINKLDGINLFLRKNPNWIGKVNFQIIVAPSREDVMFNTELLKSIKQNVAKTNSDFGTLDWQPIDFLYKIVPFKELIELYLISDVLLITSLLDGVNLISKEYVASRVNEDGVLILSDLAGSSKELKESLIIDPINISDIADKILTALMLPVEVQKDSILKMQLFLKCHNINNWANVFFEEFGRVFNSVTSL